MVKNVPRLSDVVIAARQFQRSVRIDADFGREDSLQGYICQGTARSVLENTARQILETRQRAFTWTGPYGGGKSSLALALCSLVSANSGLRKTARRILSLSDDDLVLKALPAGRDGWLVVPVVGRRGSVLSEIDRAVRLALGKSRHKAPGKIDSASLIDTLVTLAESRPQSGVLVVIDELGKFLEAAAHSGEDVYFYQELAEAASRCKGRLVVIGVLHQAFEQYAAKLGRNTRDEWAKVQGRFVDIPLVAGSDELVELTGKALETTFPHPATVVLCRTIAEGIRRRRPGVSVEFSDALDRCWPLHPVTAALLGPASKRRFGQNERSAFGFLASVEPGGFKDFLHATPAIADSYFYPHLYWDYLRTNLEPAILASPDGHRWAQGADAVERAEARGTSLHVRLTKTIALIELFRNGSGLAGDDETLKTCFPSDQGSLIAQALDDLQRWSIIRFRKHLGAWGVYAGSDFDIDTAVAEAFSAIGEPDLAVLGKSANLYPVVAKRHYYDTGTLRWMSASLCLASDIEAYVHDFTPPQGSFGEFVLAIPGRDMTERQAANRCKAARQSGVYPVVVGVPRNGEQIRELSRELQALEVVKKQRPELEGDPVARREVDARTSVVRSQLEDELRDAFLGASWYTNGEKIQDLTKGGLSPLASRLAGAIYPHSPYLFSELVNREQPSSNSNKAKKDLLYRMLTHHGKPNLGYEGFSADAGLYYTLLRSTTLHRQDDAGKWCFAVPSNNGRGATFVDAWQAAAALVFDKDHVVAANDLYGLWRQPPYGIRQGVLPILMLAFVLANKQRLAVYKDGMFVPEMQEVDIDELLQDPSRISLRHVQIDQYRREILEGITEQIGKQLGSAAKPEPLDAARVLVAHVFSLPQWVQRTQQLADTTRAIRDTLLRASDPHKVLFVDLPILFEGATPRQYVEELGNAVSELTGAYLQMLQRVMSKMLVALNARIDRPDDIIGRARTVAGISGDFLLDAFATRLTQFEDSEEFFEGLLSLALNKPPREWNDRDIDTALITLAEWALKFRQVEALAAVRDRTPTRQAIAVVFGTGEHGKTVSDTFDVAERDSPQVHELAAKLLTHIKGVQPEVFLAALAEAGMQLVEQRKGSER